MCIVSHRLGGYDGVSVEAAKWHWAFLELGWTVTRAAGFFSGARSATDVEVAGLWAPYFGGAPPPPDTEVINHLCRTNDLLVLDNVGSLPTTPHTAVEFEIAALRAGLPTIVRHHDPPWQLSSFTPSATAGFPLTDARMLHVTINRLTEGEFRQLNPALVAADAVTTIYNTVDRAGLRQGDGAAPRRRMAIPDGDLLLAHPARNIDRKNIPAALDLAGALHRRTGRRIHYWLTDPTGELDALPTGVTAHRGHVDRAADLYAAADIVALTSTWEGWGLPVVESAAARRPAVTCSYPVLAEINQIGIVTVDHGDVDTLVDLLTEPARYTAFTMANERAAAALDIRRLPTILGQAATRAIMLMNPGRQPTPPASGSHC
ncbi:glycosyltransferase family 4 protein [Mycolicibacterium sp.]|uniref:glycosyltransferase family 4 protein n=1 Tax=Mycolicibacterium sp. TaxID=2320850 RepID=UPI0028ABE013|nr:glycosyltransferase family 4 protein [Mycolicibacterium sp.]